MPIEIVAVLLAAALAIIVAVSSYLYLKIAKQVDGLYELHTKDVAALTDFMILVSREYYTSKATDHLINNFRLYLDERFNNIEKMIDRRKV